MAFQLLINGISLGSVYALIAVGFAVVFSILKFSNFAHGGMISAAAYIAYFFQSSFSEKPSIFLTMLFTSIACVFLALILDFLCYRNIRKRNSPSIYYFVASITFAILIEQILTVAFGKSSFAIGRLFDTPSLKFLGANIPSMDAFMLAVSLVMLILLIFAMNKTKIGLAIRAVSINSRTAKLMGVNSSLIIIVTFAIAGFLAGVSGTLLAAKYSVYPTLGSSMIVKGFVASVLGGLGSLGGAIAAAILLGIIEVFLTFTIGSSVTPAVVFGIMLLFLFIRPQGLAGKFAKEKV